MTTTDYLTIKDVYKSFGDVEILKEINLTCKKGELICLLGPSGCGKTTLLRIIAGLETQNSGTLTQDGKDISHLPAEQRDFGIVFQSYALFPNLTVEKNIGYGLRKQADKAQRVTELMAMVGLSDHAKKYPSQISGGQQQRVALARALAIKPNLLLLDEPLSALDAKVREHLRQEIKQLQQKLGVTTLMVTHDQEEAMSMADRIVVINAGRIEQIDTPNGVYNNPATPFVADFIGSMNLLPATINAQGKATCLELAIDYTVPEQTTQPFNIGVRPEHISLYPQQDCADTLPVTIEKIEFLGAFVRLYCHHNLSDQSILVDIDNEQFITDKISVGLQVSLKINTKYIKVYGNLGE